MIRYRLRLFWVFLFIFLSQQGLAADFPFVPRGIWTSGSLCTAKNPDFKKYAYKERIAKCHRSVSSAQKRRIYEKYKVPSKCRRHYTIDHFIPLSMGGTNEPDNLWPEHKNIKATRQDLEFDVFLELRDGRITQETAIDIIIQEKTNPPIKEVEVDSCMRIHINPKLPLVVGAQH